MIALSPYNSIICLSRLLQPAPPGRSVGRRRRVLVVVAPNVRTPRSRLPPRYSRRRQTPLVIISINNSHSTLRRRYCALGVRPRRFAFVVARIGKRNITQSRGRRGHGLVPEQTENRQGIGGHGKRPADVRRQFDAGMARKTRGEYDLSVGNGSP